jgi:hypothetical protein
MMTEAQRHLLEEFNARESNLQERLDSTRRVVKWVKQVSQAQPKAFPLHQDINLLWFPLRQDINLLWKSSREGRLH